ncbi:hypothetical protein HaLaN_03436 [Haematococcus lacustris]|uniref:Uncharacterized protein n=1 Tax=Haematococcus lacustris TaxID=44745 RepID=A0A699YNH7_HAELA|nr:hypothetical protein HaLaN_03436 [Haematococcus lacustris]
MCTGNAQSDTSLPFPCMPGTGHGTGGANRLRSALYSLSAKGLISRALGAAFATLAVCSRCCDLEAARQLLMRCFRHSTTSSMQGRASGSCAQQCCMAGRQDRTTGPKPDHPAPPAHYLIHVRTYKILRTIKARPGAEGCPLEVPFGGAPWRCPLEVPFGGARVSDIASWVSVGMSSGPRLGFDCNEGSRLRAKVLSEARVVGTSACQAQTALGLISFLPGIYTSFVATCCVGLPEQDACTPPGCCQESRAAGAQGLTRGHVMTNSTACQQCLNPLRYLAASGRLAGRRKVCLKSRGVMSLLTLPQHQCTTVHWAGSEWALQPVTKRRALGRQQTKLCMAENLILSNRATRIDVGQEAEAADRFPLEKLGLGRGAGRRVLLACCRVGQQAPWSQAAKGKRGDGELATHIPSQLSCEQVPAL